jgi:MFS superfamily sulfate permease-like transporter
LNPWVLGLLFIGRRSVWHDPAYLGLRQGRFYRLFFPSLVIKGMLTGIGLLIFLKQILHALGYDKDDEGDLSFF